MTYIFLLVYIQDLLYSFHDSTLDALKHPLVKFMYVSYFYLEHGRDSQSVIISMQNLMK